MGTQWHQEAIDALATMLVEAARRHSCAWGIARGIALLDSGARYPDGRPYDPKPDVMVVSRPLPDDDITGISLADSGVPLFVAEVASRSTLGNDLSIKKDIYQFIGVEEYILFDPAGHLIAPPLHAWRLEQGSYVPWVAGDDGWWHSRSLDISFRPDPPFIALRDRDGRPISLPRRALEREAQLEQALEAAQQRIAEMEAQLRQLRGE